jgi:hypothetical protein
MLSSSYKLFWMMDSLRQYAGLTVMNIQYMHKLTETSYSRILAAVKRDESVGLNGLTDVHIQQTIQRLVKGYNLGIIRPSRGRVSKYDLERLKLETVGMRTRRKNLVREPFLKVIEEASRI